MGSVCLEYDHDGLAQVLLAVMTGCKLITAISFFLSWFFCRRPQGREEIIVGTNKKENDGETSLWYETVIY